MKRVTPEQEALIKRHMEMLLAEAKKEKPMSEPCTRITDGKPRGHWRTEEEAGAFALTDENYVGNIPWRCEKCGWFHLYVPMWLLPNRVAEIRRGEEILSSPVGDQDSCLAWLRETFRPELGDEFIQIRRTELVLQ
jgi:hypothetical protein